MKYLVQCKYCGCIFFKTNDLVIRTLDMEIKCRDCKRILRMPDDLHIERENKKRIGLEGK